MKAHAKSKHICNSHKPTHRPKIAKELALPTQTKIVLKKFPNPSKNKKRNAEPNRQTKKQKQNDTQTLHWQWFTRRQGQNTSCQQAFGSMAGEVVN
jgi:hypothetical protein